MRYGRYNFDYMVFTWASVIIIWVLLYSLKADEDEETDITEIFCTAAETAAVFVCLYIILREGRLIIAGGARIGESLSGNVNTVGMHLGFYSICILYRAWSKDSLRSYAVYTMTILFALLTGSKKALICLAIGFLMYAWLNRHNMKRLAILCAAALALGAAVFCVPALYEILGRRIMEFLGTIGIGEYRYSTSTTMRLGLIDTAWECFREHPLFGGGYNYVASVSVYQVYAHSNVMEILADYGIAGFCFYYGIYAGYAAAVIRSRKMDKGVRCFLLALIINTLAMEMAAVTYTAGLMSYITLIFLSVYMDWKMRFPTSVYECRRDKEDKKDKKVKQVKQVKQVKGRSCKS